MANLFLQLGGRTLPAGNRCRQPAWWALGANAGAPAFIALMLDGLAAQD